MAETNVRGGNSRPIQHVAIRKDGWTKTARRRFLAVLGETCNVRMAATTCGKAVHSVYTLRKRDPEFAVLWAEALAIGYERLEDALLRHALASVNAIDVGEHSDEIEEPGTDAGPPAMRVEAKTIPGSGLHPATLSMSQVQVALAILNRHRASVEGRRTALRGKPRMTAAETDALLRRQLDMLARRLAASDARAADGGESTT